MLTAKSLLAAVALSAITAQAGGQNPAAPAAPHAVYQLVDLGTLGGPASHALGINNRGEVVGEADIPRRDKRGHHIYHAFLWKDGRMTDIGFTGYAMKINDRGSILCGVKRGSDFSQLLIKEGKKIPLDMDSADAINDEDEVVGCARNQALGPFQFQACVWRNGRRTFLTIGPTPSAIPITVDSGARAVNAAGAFVGYTMYESQSLKLCDFSYLWTRGKRVSLGSSTTASAINAIGQVVGWTDEDLTAGRPPRGEHALLWSGDIRQELEALPGATESFAYGINNVGQAVGQVVGRSRERACVWDQNYHRIADLNSLTSLPPGWVLKNATAINNRGQIIGQGLHNGQERAFLLNPLPVSGDHSIR